MTRQFVFATKHTVNEGPLRNSTLNCLNEYVSLCSTMSWHKSLSKKYEVKKENKYKAKKTERAGRWFDSKSESILYDALMADLHAGLWVEVRCQVSVYLTNARIQYKPDFLCIDPNGKEIYAEMKGIETSSWRIKRKLWQHYGPADLQVWNYDHRRGNLILKETIKPKVSE